MVSPRCRASTPQPAAPARRDEQPGQFCGAWRRINSGEGRQGEGPRSLPSLRARRTFEPMPLPSFGFGHRPSWEYEAPEASGAALEEPQPQPIVRGWRGKVAHRHRRGHRARPAHRASSSASSAATSPSASSTCPGGTSASRRCSPRPRSRRWASGCYAVPLRRARPGRGRALRRRDQAAARRASTSWSTTPASRATARSGGSPRRPGARCSTPTSPARSTASARWRRSSARSTTARS